MRDPANDEDKNAEFDYEQEAEKTRLQKDDAWIDPNPLPLIFPYTNAEMSDFIFGPPGQRGGGLLNALRP